ncbi:MAG: glycoside hydrolase family 76 protein [Christensenellales bacterium]|jgi:hypothetical protein|nr:hypothetical protein [Clostridiales bacterium]
MKKAITKVVAVLLICVSIAVLISTLLANFVLTKEAPMSEEERLAIQNFERANYLKQSIYDNYYNDELTMVTKVPFPFKTEIWSTFGIMIPAIQASVWGYGSFLSMLYKFALYESIVGEDLGAVAAYDNALEGLMYYRKDGTDGKFLGYRHHRDLDKGGSNMNGISYDDDMWLARDILYMYELTNDQKYLDYAVEIADYLLECGAYIDLDPQIFIDFGIEGVTPETKIGGFYWDEELDMLHTCSNGPAIIFYSELYKYTNNEIYLNTAKKAYEFVLTLRSDDGVFYDCTEFNKMGANEIVGVKRIDKRKYTYNTGTPISGAVSLYETTGDEKYLNDAIDIAKSAREVLGAPVEDKDIVWYINEGGYGGGASAWFNSVLLNGYMDLLKYTDMTREYIEEFNKTLNWVYDTYLKAMDEDDKEALFTKFALISPEANYIDKEYGKLIPAGRYVSGWAMEKYIDVDILNICGSVDMLISLAAYYAKQAE